MNSLCCTNSRNYSNKNKIHNKNITIFGDSISYASDYSAVISEMYNNGEVTIYNYAKKSAKVMHDMIRPYFGYEVVESKYDTPYIILVLIGVNDYEEVNDFFLIEYRRNLQLIKEYHSSSNILCMGILNSTIDYYRNIKNPWIEEACNLEGVIYINTDNWINPSLDTYDGTHPSINGYRKIVTQLLQYI